MPNLQLVSYISQLINQGYPDSIIKQTLLKSGWPQAEIDNAFTELNPTSPSKSPSAFSFVQGLIKPKTGSRKKGLLVVFLVLVLFASFGGGVFAYNFFQSPERKLAQVITNLDKIKTVTFEGQIKMNVNVYDIAKPLIQSQRGALPEDSGVLAATDTALNINFTGSSDSSDPSNPKTALTMKLSGFILGSLPLNIELRSLNKLLFFKLTNIPNLGIFDFAAFSNQWIKLDVASASKLSGGDGASTLDTINQKKIADSYKKHQIVQKITKLKDDKIGNNDTFHYQITVNKKELAAFINDSVGSSSNSTQTQTDSLVAAINRTDFVAFEYWIGKKDLLPYQILVDFKTGDTNSQSKVQFLLTIKNFNQKVTILAPANPKTFDEILQKYEMDQLKKQQSSLEFYNQGIYLQTSPTNSKLRIN